MGKTRAPLVLEDVARQMPRDEAGRQLREWIRDGQLGAGRRLPSERALADRLGVSRTVVRGVLGDLERERLVATLPRKGWVVAGAGAAGGGSLLRDTVLVFIDRERQEGGEGAMTEPGWHDMIYRGVSDAVVRAGHGVLTMASDTLDDAKLDRLLRSPPLGVVMAGNPPQMGTRAQVLEALHVGDIPVVAYGDEHDWPGCDVVMSDHYAGGRALTEWLIARGCRRIVRCWHDTGRELGWLHRREAGCVDALTSAGKAVLPAVGLPTPDLTDADEKQFEMTAHMFAGYLAKPLQGKRSADALMAVSDGDVPKLARACRILGRDPARDVAIVGYDRYWREVPGARWETTPPLATVDKRNWEIGATLFAMLADRLEGRTVGEPVRRLVAPELVVTKASEE